MTDTAGKSALKSDVLSGGGASGGSPTAGARVAGMRPNDGGKFNLESEVRYTSCILNSSSKGGGLLSS